MLRLKLQDKECHRTPCRGGLSCARVDASYAFRNPPTLASLSCCEELLGELQQGCLDPCAPAPRPRAHLGPGSSLSAVGTSEMARAGAIRGPCPLPARQG